MRYCQYLLWMIKIILDPGHGLDNRRPGVYDPGALAFHGGFRYEEATIVMDYAITMRAVLRVAGIDAVLTRSRAERLVNGQVVVEHTPAPLSKRVSMIEEHQAQALISLHLNASEDTSARGFEVFYRFDYQKPFAEVVYKHFAELVRDFMPLRGVKQAPFAVLRTTKPAVLIELGFVTNANDAQFIRPLDVQEYRARRIQFANALQRALSEYFPKRARR